MAENPNPFGGLFKGIDNAKTSEFGEYILDGKHRLKLLRIVLGRTRMPENSPFFVVEFEVMGSTNPMMRPGSQRNYFVKFNNDSALGNVKAVAIAIYAALAGKPVDESTVTEAAMEALVQDNGAIAKGTLYDVNSVVRHSNKTGKDYTNHAWYPVFEAAA